MLTLIIGGSGSGKSEYAEDRAVDASQSDGNLYYLATMNPSGDENQKRIKRHTEKRAGKGFITLEYSTDIINCLDNIAEDGCKNATVLLECMSNLVANEMFKDTDIISPDVIFKKIIYEIKKINKKINNLIIVSNNIFEDGIIYDDVTTSYNTLLGRINAEISAMCDEVIEVVVGIPVVIKKTK